MRSVDIQLYKDLAQASGGQAIQVTKTQLPEATSLILQSTSSNLVLYHWDEKLLRSNWLRLDSSVLLAYLYFTVASTPLSFHLDAVLWACVKPSVTLLVKRGYTNNIWFLSFSCFFHCLLFSLSQVTLLQAVRSPGKPDNFSFVVDVSVTNVTVYIVGSAPSFTLINPAGDNSLYNMYFSWYDIYNYCLNC